MIKDKGAKLDNYSISPKIRQILLHWGYELVESDVFNKKSFFIFSIYKNE